MAAYGWRDELYLISNLTPSLEEGRVDQEWLSRSPLGITVAGRLCKRNEGSNGRHLWSLLYTYSSSLEVLGRAEGKKKETRKPSMWVPLFLSYIFLIENAQPSWPVDNASSEVSFMSKIPWTLSVSFLYKKNLEEESESLPNGSSGQKETDWTHWKLFITCCPEGRIRIRKGPRLKDR